MGYISNSGCNKHEQLGLASAEGRFCTGVWITSPHFCVFCSAGGKFIFFFPLARPSSPGSSTDELQCPAVLRNGADERRKARGFMEGKYVPFFIC